MLNAALEMKPHSMTQSALVNDPRSTKILAKTIYRELRSAGLEEADVVAIATELLGRAAEDMRGR